MKRQIRLKDVRLVLPALFISAIILLVMAYYTNIEESTIIIQRVDMQQEVHGDQENGVSTSYHYRVYSDNGLYEIDQSGLLFARPELVDAVHAGDTVRVVSRGYYIPQLGIYRKIVDVRKAN